MRKISSVLLLVLFPLLTYSQKYSVDFHAGYGTYLLSGLKEFQSNMTQVYLPLPVKETVRFPGYLNYSASADFWYNSKNSIGLNGVFFTTGGRNHLKDYSGEYKLDMIMNGYRLGIQDRNILLSSGTVKIYLQLRAGILMSVFKMDEFIKINNVDSVSEGYVFTSKTFFGEPSLGFRYKVIEGLSADFCFGYQFDTEGKLHLKENKEMMLNNPAGGPVYTNWSGVRIQLGVSYTLFQK